MQTFEPNQGLAFKRCAIHADREAAAICLSCGRYHCRECVTEHEGRLLCAHCLAGQTFGKSRAKTLIPFFPVFQAGSGLFLVWLFFYYLGLILLGLPDSFHEGTIWTMPWWEAF